MRSILAIGILCVVTWFVAESVGQETPTTPSRKATDDDYKKLIGQTKFNGKVAGIGPKSISVALDDTAYQMAKRKADYLKEPQKTAYLKQLTAQMLKSGQGKEYEFEFTEKFALRKTNVLFEYDERGVPKKLDSAEIARLKGKEGHPGYMAKPEEISPGMPVTVTLTRGKGGKPLASVVLVNNAQAAP